LGSMQRTYDNPVLPNVEWDSQLRGQGKRVLSHREGAMFPLKIGNELRFLSSVDVNKEPYQWQLYWVCRTVDFIKYFQSKLGRHDVYKINCIAGDKNAANQPSQQRLTFYYAPSVGHFVTLEMHQAAKGGIVRRYLIDYGNKALAAIQHKLKIPATSVQEDNQYVIDRKSREQQQAEAIIDLTDANIDANSPVSIVPGDKIRGPGKAPAIPNQATGKFANAPSMGATGNENYNDGLYKPRIEGQGLPTSETQTLDLLAPKQAELNINTHSKNAEKAHYLPSDSFPGFDENLFDSWWSGNTYAPKPSPKEKSRYNHEDPAILDHNLSKRNLDPTSTATSLVYSGEDSLSEFKTRNRIIYPNRAVESDPLSPLLPPSQLGYSFDLDHPQSIAAREARKLDYAGQETLQPRLEDQFEKDAIYANKTNILTHKRLQRKNVKTLPPAENQPNPVYSSDEPRTRPSALHLASYKSQKDAVIGWQGFLKRFSPILHNLKPATLLVDIPDKGQYYRLYAVRANLSSDEAKRLCSELRRQHTYCEVHRP
jgi:hypothetical protein